MLQKEADVQSETIHAEDDAPFTKLALHANLAGFAFNGMLMSIYGPMLETVAFRFHVTLPVAGALLGVHFLGALIGAMAFWRMLRLRPPGTLLRCAYACLAAGFACVISAAPLHSFPLLCLGALGGGIGFGGLDCGLSQIFAMAYHRRKTEMLNLLHGCFGLGTALGPLALGVIGPSNYPVIFLLGLLVALSGIAVGERGGIAQASMRAERQATGQHEGFSILSHVTLLFVILYLLHIAAQGSVGEWEPVQLRTLGFRPDTASLWTAAYWVGIAISRLAIAHGYVRAQPRKIVIACCGGACLVAVTTFYAPVLPVSYLLFGLCIGPIFPVGLSWLTQRLHNAPDGVAVVVITSLVGGVIFPPLIGVAIASYGTIAIPCAILLISLCAAGTALLIP